MTDISIVQIIRWIVYFFPSFYDYVKMIAPIVILTVSISSVFMNIIPNPGQVYPVPCRKDIELELKDKKFIFKLTLLTRWITIKVNYIICSRPYKWFYKSAEILSSIVNKIRGNKGIGKISTISKPKVFKISFDTTKDEQ